MDHTELFKRYPQLKDIKVQAFSDKGDGLMGSFDSSTKELKLNIDRPTDEILSTFLHESQHVIQGIEGFGKGGSDISAWLKKRNKLVEDVEKDFAMEAKSIRLEFDAIQNDFKEKAEAARNKLREEYMSLGYEKSLDEYTKVQADYRERMDELAKRRRDFYDRRANARGEVEVPKDFDSFKAYQRLSGEAESRNVQTRAKLPKGRKPFPEDTLDVPAKEIDL